MPLVQIFLVFNHFFVDFNFFSSIIYILYEGGRLRPPLVTSGPGFSAERVITSRRKNGEKGWKEKGRQEAVVAVPPVPGVLSNGHPLFFFSSLALLQCPAEAGHYRNVESAFRRTEATRVSTKAGRSVTRES